MNYKYEKLNEKDNKTVNSYLKNLERQELKLKITKEEKQFMFMEYLASLNLESSVRFEIYTNTIL